MDAVVGRSERELRRLEMAVARLDREREDARGRLELAEDILASIAAERRRLSEPARAADWHLGARCVERAERYQRVVSALPALDTPAVRGKPRAGKRHLPVDTSEA